ncbi:YybH family protein [Chitinophaga alhagiae]|uniref:YybH family protein n=1 Tax=Chitinophaga alhagiae TaxID=2203219 RepID=UPI000E5B453A|nr:nuclear transport factor 2 family protein [Chitinophaga alhagiae]
MNRQKSGLAELTKESALAFGKRFEELFNEGKYREMAAYYTEDADLIGIKLPVYKGAEGIEGFWKKTCEAGRKIRLKRTIDVLDVKTENNLGYISGVVRVEIKILFLKIEKVFRYVTIWKKNIELWQLAIDISTQVKTTRRH